jgi:Protein of unknown function (DUF3572)
MSISTESAEMLALTALGWLVTNDELLPVFMGATGVGEDDIKARAGDADFLGSVLDFVMMDDAWVVAFCDASGLGYEQPMLARAALPGGEQVNWT